MISKLFIIISYLNGHISHRGTNCKISKNIDTIIKNTVKCLNFKNLRTSEPLEATEKTFLLSLLASQDYHNKVPQTRWLRNLSHSSGSYKFENKEQKDHTSSKIYREILPGFWWFPSRLSHFLDYEASLQFTVFTWPIPCVSIHMGYSFQNNNGHKD